MKQSSNKILEQTSHHFAQNAGRVSFGQLVTMRDLDKALSNKEQSTSSHDNSGYENNLMESSIGAREQLNGDKVTFSLNSPLQPLNHENNNSAPTFDNSLSHNNSSVPTFDNPFTQSEAVTNANPTLSNENPSDAPIMDNNPGS